MCMPGTAGSSAVDLRGGLPSRGFVILPSGALMGRGVTLGACSCVWGGCWMWCVLDVVCVGCGVFWIGVCWMWCVLDVGVGVDVDKGVAMEGLEW